MSLIEFGKLYEKILKYILLLDIIIISYLIISLLQDRIFLFENFMNNTVQVVLISVILVLAYLLHEFLNYNITKKRFYKLTDIKRLKNLGFQFNTYSVLKGWGISFYRYEGQFLEYFAFIDIPNKNLLTSWEVIDISIIVNADNKEKHINNLENIVVEYQYDKKLSMRVAILTKEIISKEKEGEIFNKLMELVSFAKGNRLRPVSLAEYKVLIK